MVEDKQQVRLPIWKPFILGAGIVGLAKLLHLWLSDPIAWALGAFVATMLFYETPPRIGSPPDVRMSILGSAGTGLLAFVLAKIF
jgi:hypothetical protein